MLLLDTVCGPKVQCSTNQVQLDVLWCYMVWHNVVFYPLVSCGMLRFRLSVPHKGVVLCSLVLHKESMEEYGNKNHIQDSIMENT